MPVGEFQTMADMLQGTDQAGTGTGRGCGNAADGAEKEREAEDCKMVVTR